MPVTTHMLRARITGTPCQESPRAGATQRQSLHDRRPPNPARHLVDPSPARRLVKWADVGTRGTRSISTPRVRGHLDGHRAFKFQARIGLARSRCRAFEPSRFLAPIRFRWIRVVTAARRAGLSLGPNRVQVAPHDQGDGSELGRSHPRVAGERAFSGGVRDGQGIPGIDAAWAASLLSGPGSGPSRTSSTASALEPQSRRKAGRRAPSSPAKAPRFLPVRTVAKGPALGEIVIEIGLARVRVARGFDGSLLGEVVRALGGSAR